jgi:hypothetical protein
MTYPEKWQPFVKINYAYGDTDTINRLVTNTRPNTTSRTPRSKHLSC